MSPIIQLRALKSIKQADICGGLSVRELPWSWTRFAFEGNGWSSRCQNGRGATVTAVQLHFRKLRSHVHQTMEAEGTWDCPHRSGERQTLCRMQTLIWQRVLTLNRLQSPCQCTAAGCGRRFSRKSHLSRHLLQHTGVKQFKWVRVPPYCCAPRQSLISSFLL